MAMSRVEQLEAEVRRLERLVLPEFGEDDLARAFRRGREELTERDYVRVAALTRARVASKALDSLPPPEANERWFVAQRALGQLVDVLEGLVVTVEGEL